jgi:glutathione synthase/RimK-type ligase-like ATP-grasp enzyme
VCKTYEGIRAVVTNARHNFFTKVVDSDTEYRAWVYRKRILAVYEKRLTEPAKNTRFGRNRQNGWTFHGLDTNAIPDDVRRVAVAAVKSLGLDFGAVDILGKRTPKGLVVTVLEVNSAPGVSDEHRTAYVKLVKRIVEWVRVGCPARDAAERPERRREIA